MSFNFQDRSGILRVTQCKKSSLQPTKILPPIIKGEENTSPGKSSLANSSTLVVSSFAFSATFELTRRMCIPPELEQMQTNLENKTKINP